MQIIKRRKKKKTDYRQRLGLLKSKKTRLVVRRSLNNIHVQMIKYEPSGDKTLIEVSSKNLKKYGWRGHGGNLSSAYLCGLVAGMLALKKDINSAVLDVGLQTSVKGSAIYAAAMAARDAGLSINLREEILPGMDRISGVHISNYAKSLKPNKEKYNRQFSQYIRAGIDPEKLPEHFDEVKNKILEEFGFNIKDFKKVSKKEMLEEIEEELPKEKEVLKKKKKLTEIEETKVEESSETVEEFEDVEEVDEEPTNETAEAKKSTETIDEDAW